MRAAWLSAVRFPLPEQTAQGLRALLRTVISDAVSDISRTNLIMNFLMANIKGRDS